MRPNRFLAPRQLAGLLLCALFLFNAATIAEAQSGRRPPKRPTAPDPLPPAPSEPPLVQSTTQDKKGATPILLAKEMRDLVFSSDIFLNAVMDGFMGRMAKASSVKARASSSRMNRKEASDAAKSSSDTYVVWFQLGSDSSGRSSDDYRNAQNLYIEYTIYLPGTGKSKTSGHIYQRSSRGVLGSPLPGPTTTGAGSAEYTLRYAGVELAERVLDSLNLLTMPPTN